MNALKRISIFILLIILNQSLFAQSNQIFFRPSVSIFNPGSKVLSNFYNKNVILSYGGNLAIITSFHKLGLYLGVNRFSVKIQDAHQPDLTESAALYKIGIIKRYSIGKISLDTKIGLTKRNDDLDAPGSNNSNFGFELGLVLEKHIYGRFASFIEADYNYTHIKIPEYVTYKYSRRQYYLSGKSINTGGYSFNMGVSILLN